MTSDPGRSSSRSDTGLVTCQVHELATPRRPQSAPVLAVTRLASLVAADHPAHSSLRPTSWEDTRLAGRG